MPDDTYWQSIQLVADTLLYSYDDNIVEGQSFYSWSTVESDTANYNIQKEYIVEKKSVSLKNDVLDPNCSNFGNQEACNDDDEHGMYWCSWNLSTSTCDSEYIDNINPATADIYSKCPSSKIEDINNAVLAAKNAFFSWCEKTTC